MLEVPYKNLEKTMLYRTMRSRLDNGIVELLLRIEVAHRRKELPENAILTAEKGLTIRDIRYAFGRCQPSKNSRVVGPGPYSWLKPFRRDLKACGAVDKRFMGYTAQLVWNHCDKLRRMGVLSKQGKRYRLGPDFLNNPEMLRVLRQHLKRARQDDCSSNGVVTVIGISKLQRASKHGRLLFPGTLLEDMKQELNQYASKLWSKLDQDALKKVEGYPFLRREDAVLLPLIVIDPNQVLNTK
jgi:hypothetical protein